MKLAITPRFFENKVEQLISIERKYFPFFQKYGHNFETEVLRESLKRKLPILAICCGMWTVNYYFNGSLKFDESHQAFVDEKIDVKKMVHSVIATDFIKEGVYKVNTFHSKVIDRLGEGLKSFLVAEDKTIEGLYNLEKRIIGVQFHMENKGVSENLTTQIMKKFTEL